MEDHSKLKDAQKLRKGRISRRQMVQSVLAGYAAPVFARPSPARQKVDAAAAATAAESAPSEPASNQRFLDPHQSQTLAALAERIVPGSTEAQVSQFIDLLLSVDTQENQHAFVESLSAFDGLALKLNQRPFLSLTESEQNRLLSLASTGEATGVATLSRELGRRARPHASTQADEKPGQKTLFDHFQNLKRWIVGAYYSSEVGMKDLGWTGQVFFPAFPGCSKPS